MTNPNNQTPSQALQKRLEILASMISMGEKIAWGSDSALMLEAAAMLAAKDAEIATLKNHLADAQELIQKMMVKPDGWISIADRLPKKWDEVIVWPHPGDYCMTGQLEGSRWTYGEYDRYGAQTVPMRDPTHWMPVPTAPAKPAPAADACLGSPDKP